MVVVPNIYETGGVYNVQVIASVHRELLEIVCRGGVYNVQVIASVERWSMRMPAPGLAVLQDSLAIKFI